MLFRSGADATEQCLIVPDVNFLNTSDLDGTLLPPAGAPNIIVAAGGSQLKGVLADDGLLTWQMHVDWTDPAKTRLDGPVRIPVAPYEYLCGGQLTRCVPQPGTDMRLDAQGDKIMARLVYRRFTSHEALVAVHSVNTAAGAGGLSHSSGPQVGRLRSGRERTVTGLMLSKIRGIRVLFSCAHHGD